MAVTAYKIVRASDAAGLSAEVTAALADEWQPLGGPIRDQNGGSLLQALVKESEAEPDPEVPVE